MLDRPKSGCPVVERARQNNADHPIVISGGGGTKQRIDGGTKPIFFRTARDTNAPRFDEQMAVGWCHVNPVRLIRLIIISVGGANLPGTIEHLRQYAAHVRRFA